MTSSTPRVAVHLAVLAWPINFAWEMAQAYLYASMGTVREATWQCLVASVWDVAIVLAIAAVTSLVFGSTAWLAERRPAAFAVAALIGAAVAVVIEWRALGLERWAYGSRMPVIPGLNVGIVPILQMVLLPAVIFLLARTTSSRCGARLATGHVA